MRLRLERWPSPVATLLLVTDREGVLRALEFDDREARMRRLLREHYGSFELDDGPAPDAVKGALAAYFDGDLGAIDAVGTATAGTPFQRAVWCALRTIPADGPISYGRLAERVGRPGACRAVGAANGANPISIVVPCHRVIGAGGKLTGYAGGLARKRWLLDHEARFAGSVLASAMTPSIPVVA